ncbi:unnamed protein product [Urochloa humidicola]
MATRWVILSRIIRVVPGPGGAAAGPSAQEQHAAAAPDFTLPAMSPPWVTVLFAGRGAHPDPENRDGCPYIIAAGSHCLLARFSVHPFHGAQFINSGQGLFDSNLVVVRDFRRGADGRGQAVAEPVQRRNGRIPEISSLGNVSFATSNTGGYQIAELQTDRGSERATVICFRSTRLEGWGGKYMAVPPEARDRERIPHGALHADGNLWWFDLTWGILSCDASIRDDALVFHELPAGRGLAEGEEPPHIHTRRCVTGSRSKLRYVEIIADDDGGGGAPRVSMWTRNLNPDGEGWRWDSEYAVSLEEIWDDESYKKTGLTRSVPSLAVVSLWDPHLVYFFLEQRIFGVNVPQHRVEHDAAYVPPDMPWDVAGPVSGQYLLAWYLPPVPPVPRYDDSCVSANSSLFLFHFILRGCNLLFRDHGHGVPAILMPCVELHISCSNIALIDLHWPKCSNAAATGSAPGSATNVGCKRPRPPEGPEGGGS